MVRVPIIRAMTKAELLRRIDAYIKKAGCTESTASLRVFNDGKRLKQLRKKSRLWPETMQAASDQLDKLEADLSKNSTEAA